MEKLLIKTWYNSIKWTYGILVLLFVWKSEEFVVVNWFNGLNMVASSTSPLRRGNLPHRPRNSGWGVASHSAGFY